MCKIQLSVCFIKLFEPLFVFLLNFAFILRCHFYDTDNVTDICNHEVHRIRQGFDQVCMS